MIAATSRLNIFINCSILFESHSISTRISYSEPWRKDFLDSICTTFIPRSFVHDREKYVLSQYFSNVLSSAILIARNFEKKNYLYISRTKHYKCIIYPMMKIIISKLKNKYLYLSNDTKGCLNMSDHISLAIFEFCNMLHFFIVRLFI